MVVVMCVDEDGLVAAETGKAVAVGGSGKCGLFERVICSIGIAASEAIEDVGWEGSVLVCEAFVLDIRLRHSRLVALEHPARGDVDASSSSSISCCWFRFDIVGVVEGSMLEMVEELRMITLKPHKSFRSVSDS